MEQNKNILENLAPSLEEIFKRNLTFMRGVCPDNFILNSFEGLSLGSFQQLSTIEKLLVLEIGMNLILDEDVFKYDPTLIKAWEETKPACSKIYSEKTKNTIYLINIIENYCNVFQIATMRGYHLALLCAEYKIHLSDKEIREHGESNFKEDLYNAINEIDKDEGFTFSKEFYLVHKQAWINGFFTGFKTSEEGKNHTDYLLLQNACKMKSEDELSGRQKLLNLLKELKNEDK